MAAGFDDFEPEPFELDEPESDFPESDLREDWSDPDVLASDFPGSELLESLPDSELPELEPFSLDFEPLPSESWEPDRFDELRLSVL